MSVTVALALVSLRAVIHFSQCLGRTVPRLELLEPAGPPGAGLTGNCSTNGPAGALTVVVTQHRG